MSQTTEDCLLLLKDIPGNYPVPFEYAWVGGTPEKLMGSIESGMALMAVSTSTSSSGTNINMRLPSVKKALEKLAREGPGHEMECSEVRFKFVELADGKWGVSMGLEEL